MRNGMHRRSSSKQWGRLVQIMLWDVVHAIEAATGKTLNYNQIPAEDLIATEPRDVIASKNDVKVLLGGTATSFEDGIRATYTYYATSLR